MNIASETGVVGSIAILVVGVLVYLVRSLVVPVVRVINDQSEIVRAYIAESANNVKVLGQVAENLAQVSASLGVLHADHDRLQGNQQAFIGVLSAEVCQVPDCPLRNKTSDMAMKLRRAATEKIMAAQNGTAVQKK